MGRSATDHLLQPGLLMEDPPDISQHPPHAAAGAQEIYMANQKQLERNGYIHSALRKE